MTEIKRIRTKNKLNCQVIKNETISIQLNLESAKNYIQKAVCVRIANLARCNKKDTFFLLKAILYAQH